MIQLLRVPRLYPEMEEATIGRWLVRSGELAESRAPVVEIITDKVAFEVEAPEGPSALTLLVECAPEKSVLPVNSILAVLGSPGDSLEAVPDWQAENERLARARQDSLQVGSAPEREPGASPAGAPSAAGRAESRPGLTTGAAGVIRATPAARRAARAAGVSLEEVASFAAGAAVTETDVERFLARPSDASPERKPDP